MNGTEGIFIIFSHRQGRQDEVPFPGRDGEFDGTGHPVFAKACPDVVDSHSLRQPLGVEARITPFNFPVMVPLWMFPFAIACGNTFVLKPSGRAPAAPTRVVELLSEAGAPDGVLNVVHGVKVAVDALLEHERVQAVTLVGSTRVARYIDPTGAANGKRDQTPGGAKNHVDIVPEVDLDNAAAAQVGAEFGSAGERCMATPRRSR